MSWKGRFMLSRFLANNRADLISRCQAKVALRPIHATPDQLKHGVPLVLMQLQRTLEAEAANDLRESVSISGTTSGAAAAPSEIGVSAAVHGEELLALGFTIEQVVHNYGDLCQAITDLAVERDAPFSVVEFRTLNRCLDNAIAEAVHGFSRRRDESLGNGANADANERVLVLVQETREVLQNATLAASALELGNLSITGATGATLKRGHATMAVLLDQAVAEATQL